MASGIVSLKKPGEITPGGFKPHELEVIVEEAARAGLSVMAHANGDEAIGACALAGVRSVEHGFFMTEKSLGLLAAKGVFWVPTVGALRRAADASGAPDAVRQFIDGLIGRQLAMIRAAYSAGVSLAVGTDRVLPDERYAPAYEAELAHFERAGIPRAEVIRIASEGGARLLGM
jgi:imidazolonepropionase-like amidohydrolase